jgi:hypothetical protein
VYDTCGSFHDGSEKGTLTKHKMAVIPHPLYSPDLVSCDFFLLPKIKLKLKGCRFDTTEEI